MSPASRPDSRASDPIPEDRFQRTPFTEEDWCRGDRYAPVTILMYGDFECTRCAAVAPILEGLLHEDPERLRVIYRHFPLVAEHPASALAAEAVEAAGAQGKFWQMHDALFADQPPFDIDHIRRIAYRIHLQLLLYDRAMNVHTYLPVVKRDIRRASEDGVEGTPTIFINKVRYEEPLDRDAILAVIEELQTDKG